MVLDFEFLQTNIPVQKYPILKFIDEMKNGGEIAAAIPQAHRYLIIELDCRQSKLKDIQKMQRNKLFEIFHTDH